MSVQEIEEQIARLNALEVAELARWFASRDAEVLDERIEADSRSGGLDRLIAQANAECNAGKCSQRSPA